MPYKIVVNGCSFTQEFHLQEKHRWSNLIECDVNLAHGGGSNHRIFQTSLEFLNNETPDVLIIGWTGIDRSMFYASTGSRVIVAPSRSFNEDTGDTEEHIHKFYYKNLHNGFVNFHNTLNYMIHLQNYCKCKGIRLIYWNACLPNLDQKFLFDISKQAYMSRVDKNTEMKGIVNNKKILDNLIDKLDKDIWIKEFWYGINTHCEGFPWRKDGHVDYEGSAYWAELVKKYL